MSFTDYHLEGPPSRCPYALQASNGGTSHYFRSPQFRDNYNYALTPSFQNPLTWAETYQRLPPIPTNINIHNHYGHSHSEYAPPQIRNMAESAADESNFNQPRRTIPWNAPHETERSGSTSSESSSTTEVYGGNSNTNTRIPERAFPPRTLPPIAPLVSSADWHNLHYSQIHSAQHMAARSEQGTGRIDMHNQEPHPSNDRSPTPYHLEPPGIRSGNAQSTLHGGSSATSFTPRHSTARSAEVRHPERLHDAASAPAVPTLNEDALSPAEMAFLQDHPSFETYLDQNIPLLLNGNRSRMDDLVHLDHSALRLRIIREMISQGVPRPVPKKTGASKAALDSLVRVPISELEEDDRLCQICYNDYGVENPDGGKEDPIRMPKCKHVFGEVCLKKWLENKSTCPYCRDQLPSEAHHRARRSLAEPRRLRTELSPRESLISRVNASSSRPHNSRHTDASPARRPDSAGPYSVSSGSESTLEEQERIANISRERAAALAARRSRGRANNGRTISAASDPQQMPMRVPIGYGAYVPRQYPSFGGRVPGSGQNTTVAPRTHRVSATNSSGQERSLWSTSSSTNPQNPHFSLAVPYATDYPIEFPGQQNESLQPSLDDLFAGAEVSNPGSGTSRSSALNEGLSIFAQDFPDLDGTYMPSLTTLDGERRTLHSISQQVSEGHSPTERPSHNSQTSDFYPDGDLRPHLHLRRTEERQHQADETHRHQIRQTQNENPAMRGTHLDDGFLGAMLPPAIPYTRTISGMGQAQGRDQYQHWYTDY